MNEQQGMTRFVEATERIAKALERIAEQQAQFLAVMPEEPPEVKVDVVDPVADPTATLPPILPDRPLHEYNALCGCQVCWTHRHKARQA